MYHSSVYTCFSISASIHGGRLEFYEQDISSWSYIIHMVACAGLHVPYCPFVPLVTIYD